MKKKKGRMDPREVASDRIQEGSVDEEARVEAIGREMEKKEVIDQLILLQNKTSEKSAVPLVAIVGKAGIGKDKTCPPRVRG